MVTLLGTYTHLLFYWVSTTLLCLHKITDCCPFVDIHNVSAHLLPIRQWNGWWNSAWHYAQINLQLLIIVGLWPQHCCSLGIFGWQIVFNSSGLLRFLKSQTMLLCLMHSYQHHKHNYITVAAVLRMVHHPNNIWSVMVLWWFRSTDGQCRGRMASCA